MEGLRAARKRAGLTQQQLAKLADTTQHTISEAERGRREPRAQTLKKIAEALGVPVDALFEGRPVALRDATELLDIAVWLEARLAEKKDPAWVVLDGVQTALDAELKVINAFEKDEIPPAMRSEAVELMMQAHGIAHRLTNRLEELRPNRPEELRPSERDPEIEQMVARARDLQRDARSA